MVLQDRLRVSQRRHVPLADIEEQKLRRRKRTRSTNGSRDLLRAEYPHHVWAIDFQFDQTMDGRTLKFLKVIDEYSQVCLAIRVGRRRTAVDLSSLPMPCRSGAQATVKQGHISRQVHPGRIHLWNHSTKDLGMNSCRRSRPEATY